MEELICYNRGCVQKKFFPRENDENEAPCTYHPGAPYFHDAYKGWSCCDLKSTDFTVFLNYPGCAKGKHNNVKPVEPENITGNLSKEEVVPEPVRKPISSTAVTAARPRFDAPMSRVKPTLARSLVDQLKKNPLKVSGSDANGANDAQSDAVPVGESCKNGGCKASFTGDDSTDCSSCRHHPGVPIFHEGMKFWSCCQKRTSDFTAFLNQEGCTSGAHKWKKEVALNEGGSTVVNCRNDWHQTPERVTIAIYCKKYDPDASFVEVGPVRLKTHVSFPEEAGAFDWDLELTGVISPDKTTVAMMGTKIEIQLYKLEPGSWTRLDVPQVNKEIPKDDADKVDEVDDSVENVDALDLDDLDLSAPKLQLSNIASGGRTDQEII